jgi:signal peptidase II
VIRNKYFMLLAIAGAVIVLDQLTKIWVVRVLVPYDTVPVIPGFFSLTHLQNPGGAFGFLAEQSIWVRRFFFLFVSVIAVGIVFFIYRKTPSTHPWLRLGLAFIFGGAIGNLIDRFRFGAVTDFLLFYIGKYQWPAFNVADSAISVGIGIFILHLVLNKMPDG